MTENKYMYNVIVVTGLHDRIQRYLKERGIAEGFVDKILVLCPGTCDIPEDWVEDANKRWAFCKRFHRTSS